MAVLLIGSTGNGKSTFGNYLLDPSEDHLFTKQTFKTAQNNLPETQTVKECKKVVKHGECDETFLTVIDTPGLNEDAERDLQHMIQIVEQLQGVHAIRACVFVVKFNSKIDSQYRATIQYYRKLLPSLFEKNVTVVITDFATDSRSEMLRKKQGVDVDTVLSNTRREIVVNGQLSYDPMMFSIDCLPLDEDEQAASMQTRDAFLQYVAQMEPFSDTSFTVAKTPYVLMKDKERIMTYEGEITGYNVRLKEANEAAKESLEHEEKKEKEITDALKEIREIESKIKEMDSEEHATAASYNLEVKWKLFRWQESVYDLKSKWKVVDVKKWTNRHCTWHDETKEDYRIKGRLKGSFMRGLYANLTALTMKKLKFADEIAQLKQDLDDAKSHRERLAEELKRIQAKYHEYIKDLKLLETFIEKRRENITALSSNNMTMSEAKEHLSELQKLKDEIV